MLIVGLTGGIGSGKSTVAQLFAELKVPIIDADEIAHQLVLPTSLAYERIVEHFGTAILQKNNLLDRKKLREFIFNNAQEKKWLEQLLHPEILKTMQERITILSYPYAIVVIPLLFETPNINYDFIHRILVVDTLETLQIKRTTLRDHSNLTLVQQIIDQQVSRQTRLQLADDVIENDTTKEHLKASVLKLHHFYLSLAKNHP